MPLPTPWFDKMTDADYQKKVSSWKPPSKPDFEFGVKVDPVVLRIKEITRNGNMTIFFN